MNKQKDILIKQVFCCSSCGKYTESSSRKCKYCGKKLPDYEKLVRIMEMGSSKKALDFCKSRKRIK